MKRDPHRRIRHIIAAHFAGRGVPALERELRLHLPECADCRDYYQRHLVIAAFDPAAVPALDRLASGLGLHGARSPQRSALFGFSSLAGVAAMAALALFLSAAPWRRDEASGFMARGRPIPAASLAPELMVYRVAKPGAPAEPAGSVISSRDELAFAYRNPAGGQAEANSGSKPNATDWLLIFAVDEHGHVYWYHPGWSNAAENPTAIPASRQPGIHELPAAVAHQFDGKSVAIHAVFTDHPVTVRQIEAAVAARVETAGARSGPGLNGGAAAAPGDGPVSSRVTTWPGAVDIRRDFTVVP